MGGNISPGGGGWGEGGCSAAEDALFALTFSEGKGSVP